MINKNGDVIIEGKKVTIPEGVVIDEEGMIPVDLADYIEPEEEEEDYRYMPLNTDNLEEVRIDTSDFKLGVDAMSYAAGQITALCNVGMTPEQAMEFVLSSKTMELQEKLHKMNVTKDIQVAKFAGAQIEAREI